jgi:hypothetical protein
MESFSCHRARAVACPATTLLVLAVALARLAAPAAAADSSGGWQRPVDGAVARPFEEPPSVYGPGHRGVDFTAVAGTPVVAANDGTVSFAGEVAGTLHVTVAHAGGLRTSYSFLASVAVHAGETVRRGEVVGTTGGTGPDHDGGVLHFGLRVGERYVDPMVLFRPADLTKLVHLVPADDPEESAWTPAAEARELQLTLHLPVPGARTDAADDGGCGDDIPLIGGVVSAACDVGVWVGDRAGDALDGGLAALDAVTGLADGVIAGLRRPLTAVLEQLRELPAALAAELARTPPGMLALDVVEMGRRFADTVFAECGDAPPADGTGGSTHRVMVVGGIDSHGAAGARGPTVGLDVDALGYHRDEGEVRYFSYASDGGAYDEADTHIDLRVAAARLAQQLRAMQREQPGREVDLIAHSQGGIVVDWFIQNIYRPGDRSYPPIGTVVTLSSPHEGAPLATLADDVRRSAVGREVLDTIGDHVTSVPEPNSPAVRELSERSATIAEIQRRGVPDHFDVTSVGATEDLVVPATNTGLRGAEQTTVAVDAVSEHSAIVDDPNALQAVRAALEGRPPPCVDVLDALRGAIAPVVISRVSHLAGDLAGTSLGGTAP